MATVGNATPAAGSSCGAQSVAAGVETPEPEVYYGADARALPASRLFRAMLKKVEKRKGCPTEEVPPSPGSERDASAGVPPASSSAPGDRTARMSEPLLERLRRRARGSPRCATRGA
eukprot:355690-Chlamydomonas_euryale.AAC.8